MLNVNGDVSASGIAQPSEEFAKNNAEVGHLGAGVLTKAAFWNVGVPAAVAVLCPATAPVILNKSVALHPQYPVARSKLDHLALSLEVT